LPRATNAAAAKADNLRQSLPPGAPPASASMPDPVDLVERALAILDEEAEAWQARRTTDFPSSGDR
jgi:hypothetical protein